MMKPVPSARIRRALTLSLLVVCSFAALSLAAHIGSLLVQLLTAIVAGVSAVLAVNAITDDEPQVRVVRVAAPHHIVVHRRAAQRSTARSYGGSV